MNLQEFLNNNPVEGMTTEAVISDRFRDENGEMMKFKIKALSHTEFEAMRKKVTKTSFDRGNQTVEFDSSAFTVSLVIENTLEPNFKDAESIRGLGCATPEQYINKVMLAGEVQELATQINTFSGFNVNINTLVDEAKN